jgi:hypothetical protein
LFSKLHIVLLLKPGWIATPWLLWPFLDNLGLSPNMIYSVWMMNPARALRTRLPIALQVLLQNVFKTKKSVSIKMGKMGFLENKRKTCLDEMDGDSCVGCQMVCSYLCGWARSGDIHLVTIKDRVEVSSCLTQLSCKPLDHCMWQRLSINPTSWSDSHPESWEQWVIKEKG